jgi:putative ATP-binding cassette transporter
VAGLFLLTMAQVGISVWGNYWNRALFDALEQRSVPGLLVQVGVFAVILAVSVGVTAAHLAVKRWLQLDWRRWLTARLTGAWLAEGRQQRLQFFPGEHDNPDARIAEDVRIATEGAVALAHSLAFAVLSLALFIGILWDVSGTLRLPGSAFAVPGYLVPLAFAYAGAGTLLGWMFGCRARKRISASASRAPASMPRPSPSPAASPASGRRPATGSGTSPATGTASPLPTSASSRSALPTVRSCRYSPCWSRRPSTSSASCPWGC